MSCASSPQKPWGFVEDMRLPAGGLGQGRVHGRPWSIRKQQNRAGRSWKIEIWRIRKGILVGGLEHDFYFPHWDDDPIWRTHIFRGGWNHQLELYDVSNCLRPCRVATDVGGTLGNPQGFVAWTLGRFGSKWSANKKRMVFRVHHWYAIWVEHDSILFQLYIVRIWIYIYIWWWRWRWRWWWWFQSTKYFPLFDPADCPEVGAKSQAATTTFSSKSDCWQALRRPFDLQISWGIVLMGSMG
jgi:hypothetical protein